MATVLPSWPFAMLDSLDNFAALGFVLLGFAAIDLLRKYALLVTAGLSVIALILGLAVLIAADAKVGATAQPAGEHILIVFSHAFEPRMPR